MSKQRENITIKGTKDGFVFHLSPTCSFEDLLEELRSKLTDTHHQLLSGPLVHVHVRTGQRTLTEEQKYEILHVLREKNNLLIQSIQSDEMLKSSADGILRTQVLMGIVRSGQVLEHDGDLLFIGDINPGGTIRCSGNLYVMGALRGTAHAGLHGDTGAIIAASYMKPTQLRIAGVISRPPDEGEVDKGQMELAFLQGEAISIEKITHMHRVQDIMERWGEFLWEKQS